MSIRHVRVCPAGIDVCVLCLLLDILCAHCLAVRCYISVSISQVINYALNIDQSMCSPNSLSGHTIMQQNHFVTIIRVLFAVTDSVF